MRTTPDQKLRELGWFLRICLLNRTYRQVISKFFCLWQMLYEKFVSKEAFENRLTQFLGNKDEGFDERGILKLKLQFHSIGGNYISKYM